MPAQLMSPRLPGVNILAPETTGSQYARWRRGLESAFEAKGTWGHCDGTTPMPMPASGPNFFSPATASNPQPELLEERRAWVKKDRDVKLDVFLSVADDIKLEVFEVGPPLPPSAMTAKEMLEALDDRFESFQFEDYHHVFCHFLNLHIDQYASLEDFNAEFNATLDDLMDHGYPLDHVQACSAYFSKLRCTQNPWVAKKLKEWDTLSTPPQLEELMKECPPWMIIRPLAMKPTSQKSAPESVSEDLMGPPSIKEEEEEGSSSDTDKSEKSGIATPSSTSSAQHSRKSSSHSSKSAQTTHSTQSQEITVGASVEDLTEISAFPRAVQKLPKARLSVPKRVGSRSDVSKLSPLLPPINRPLPPLPAEQSTTPSGSPKPNSVRSLKMDSTPEPLIKVATRPVTPQPQTKSEQQPQSQPQNQSDIHPALRAEAPTPISTPPLFTPPTPAAPSTPEMHQTRPSTSHSPSPPTLAPPFSYTPDLARRPSSSRGSPSKSSLLNTQASMETVSTWPPIRQSPLHRTDSNGSSIISLPLQGVTIPEYRDTVMGGAGNNAQTVGLGLGLGMPRDSAATLVGSQSLLSASPPRSLMSRLSAELNDDEKHKRKRSWSIKAGLSARLSARKYEVKEII